MYVPIIYFGFRTATNVEVEADETESSVAENDIISQTKSTYD